MIKRVNNPPGRFSSEIIEWLDESADGTPLAKLQIYEESAKSIISSNKSPDIGFEFSVNPYRGCHHGCAYCYARPTHQYLDFGSGTDFERKIVVKVNAPDLLRKAFLKRGWKGDVLVFSGVTDCYQPVEAHYRITRQCLEICDEFCNPVSIITKGALIRRDIDVLSSINGRTDLRVYISLAFSDDNMARAIEPYAPSPSVRLRAIKALASAGIKVGIGLAPVIPGLNDTQIPDILEKAREAGAETAFMTLLRLPLEVADTFIDNINENFPMRVGKITNQIKAMRGNRLNQYQFGRRMRGQGQQWQVIKYLFDSNLERLGFNQVERRIGLDSEPRTTFRIPQQQLQLI